MVQFRSINRGTVFTFILVTATWPAAFLFGQQPSIRSTLVYSHSFTTEQGLSQNNVSSIMKDRDGFIWVGTADGLNRFDGYSFTKFFHSDQDSSSLSNDVVRCLLLDSHGRLWIGTYNGLNLYDSDTETFKKFLANDSDGNAISHNTILCLFEDRNHQLWVGTYLGLNKIDLQTFKITKYYHHPDGTGLADNAVKALFEDKYGKIWVGTAKGITIIGKNGVERTILQKPAAGGLTFALIADIVQDSTGVIYLGTNGGGLLRLDNEYDQSFEYLTHSEKEYSLGNDIISTLSLDRKGALLVGTDGEGLYRHMGDGKFVKILARESRIFDHAGVQRIFVDEQNNVWVGVFGAGLTLISGNPPLFEHYKFFNSDMERFGKNSVLSIAEDHDQKIWIGTDGAGLYKFDPSTKEFTTYLHAPANKNSISTNVVKSLLVDDKNNLYIGTYAGGLNHFDTEQHVFTRYLHNPKDTQSISTNHVWSLLEDRNKRIFVGQLGGLDEFFPETKTFKALTIPRGGHVTSQTASVFSMAEDNKGYVWMGTRLAGIHRYDPRSGNFKSFLNSPADSTSIPSNEILDFEPDPDGGLLIGTDNKGMISFDPETFTFSELVHEFREKNIPSILKDNAGYIWFTSFDGLHKFDPHSGKTYNFTMADGLQGLQYNEDACLKSSTGEYYFGGTNGLNVFRSNKVPEDQSKPNVVFTRLTLFHDVVQINDKSRILKKSIVKSKAITLQPDQNVFSIEFACLEYRFPKKNQYRYCLEGFDNAWNSIHENRTATYTNLPPGEYTLRVSASNGEGYWNNEAASIQITVIPKWYQRLDIRIAFAALVILSLLTIIHIRTRFLFRQKRNLEHLVKLRTALIASQKEEIKNKNEALEHAYEEVKTINEELHRVNTNLEKMVENKTEELRETIRKLTETGNGLDTFLYRSSHDLRGPIASLMGLARLAKMQNHQEDLDACFENIENISIKMLRLLKKLNDTGVLFRGKLKLESIDIDDFIRSITPEINNYNCNNRVSLEIENKVTGPIISDPALLSGIVLNLVENSIAFRGENNPFVKCIFSHDEQYLTIKVIDNGTGISPTDKEKIFDMFYRGSEKSTGNGLGLFMVKKALEVLQGTIEIESQPGSFTTVIVRMPVSHPDTSYNDTVTLSRQASPGSFQINMT
jgi:ligand-binding sensor domain-containing protein/signal transduction histidine kinase